MNDEHLTRTDLELMDRAVRDAAPVDLTPSIRLYRDGDGGTFLKRGNEDITNKGPYRKRGTVNLLTHQSLIRYVNRHIDERTVIYNDRTGNFYAVLNDHGKGELGWRDHVAHMSADWTPEFLDWQSANGTAMSQEDFASFLDNHRRDILSPTGADLLELIQAFEVTSNAVFKSARRLDNGEIQFAYTEQVEGKSGRDGTSAIPSVFIIAVSLFEGTEPQQMEVFLRYRMRSGVLELWVVIPDIRLHKNIVLREMAEFIEEQTGAPVLDGDLPPALNVAPIY